MSSRTVLKVFGMGRDFVSRSEARRILEGIDQFHEVVVDFDGVQSVGPSFADEMFRVFPNACPGILMVPIRMSDAVTFFVERALRAASEKPSGGSKKLG